MNLNAASGSVRFRFEPIFEPDLATTTEVPLILGVGWRNTDQELICASLMSLNAECAHISEFQSSFITCLIFDPWLYPQSIRLCDRYRNVSEAG